MWCSTSTRSMPSHGGQRSSARSSYGQHRHMHGHEMMGTGCIVPDLVSGGRRTHAVCSHLCHVMSRDMSCAGVTVFDRGIPSFLATAVSAAIFTAHPWHLLSRWHVLRVSWLLSSLVCVCVAVLMLVLLCLCVVADVGHDAQVGHIDWSTAQGSAWCMCDGANVCTSCARARRRISW